MTATQDPLLRGAIESRQRLVRGDFSAVGTRLAALARAQPLSARAWKCALESQLWLAFPERPEPDRRLVCEALTGPLPAREAALYCLFDEALVAFLGFDTARLRAGRDLVDSADADVGAEARASAELVRALDDLASDRCDAACQRTDRVAREASAQQLAAPLVEATALRALCQADGGDYAGALASARRASLMGRTEGIPHAEFLAHLCLARARRLDRQPHLALRVVSALRRVVTPRWRAWLAWEWLWAGGDTDAAQGDLATAPQSPASGSVRGLLATLSAGRDGDRPAFDRSAGTLLESASPAFVATEFRSLVEAMDPSRNATTRRLADWRHGRSILTPPSLHGLRLRAATDDSPETACSYVRCSPDGTALRLLHWGLGLVAGEESTRLRQSQRTQGRVEILLAVLALAGPEGMEEGDCFAQAYGFVFDANVHRGVFDVALHRARSTLRDVGSIERDSGRLKLVVQRELLVPDPRTSQRMTDRVLRLLSQQGAASARDAASGLGISLRAAQGALKELAESGVCDAVREGRNVHYVVEDTVFSEPTRRLVAEQLR